MLPGSELGSAFSVEFVLELREEVGMEPESKLGV